MTVTDYTTMPWMTRVIEVFDEFTGEGGWERVR